MNDDIISHISEEAYANLILWQNDDKFIEQRTELESLLASQDWPEIEDAFYTRVRVGTGGIRGKVAVGPNRINIRTIGEAAQGLSRFIEDFGEEAKIKGVVVGHEVRKSSEEFAKVCCEVFAANGIKTWLFDGIRSTPEISFAVRHLGATAGVQITASHNPRTDNGFKFYWTDGGQVVSPLDLRFMDMVQSVDTIPSIDYDDALKKGLVQVVGKDIDDAYYAAVQGLSLIESRSAAVTYSPIHGAGITNVLPVLQNAGFEVQTVSEQIEPDGRFPTAYGNLINPEFYEVMELAIKRGEEQGADVVLMSDPDADRLGVAARKNLDNTSLVQLSGNEIGIALTAFIIEQLKVKGQLPENGLVIKTNVTSSMVSAIARGENLESIDDLLVGFKFIGEIIEKLKDKDQFVFAAEESLGYLRGTFVRDKDAAITALLTAELVSWLKDQNKTVFDYLDEQYIKYGYFKNVLHYIELRGGREDKERIANIMKGLYANQPTEIIGIIILEHEDRLPAEKRNPETYVPGWTGDQLAYYLSEDKLSKIVVRPSGTEPVAKVYIQYFSEVRGNLAEVKQRVDKQVADLERDFVAICETHMNVQTTLDQ